MVQPRLEYRRRPSPVLGRTEDENHIGRARLVHVRLDLDLPFDMPEPGEKPGQQNRQRDPCQFLHVQDAVASYNTVSGVRFEGRSACRTAPVCKHGGLRDYTPRGSTVLKSDRYPPPEL